MEVVQRVPLLKRRFHGTFFLLVECNGIKKTFVTTKNRKEERNSARATLGRNI